MLRICFSSCPCFVDWQLLWENWDDNPQLQTLLTTSLRNVDECICHFPKRDIQLKGSISWECAWFYSSDARVRCDLAAVQETGLLCPTNDSNLERPYSPGEKGRKVSTSFAIQFLPLLQLCRQSEQESVLFVVCALCCGPIVKGTQDKGWHIHRNT